MRYSVKTFRAAGLEAKWGRSRSGTPFIFARDPKAIAPHQRNIWWMIDGDAWERMKKVGIREGFTGTTLLGDLFSVPA